MTPVVEAPVVDAPVIEAPVAAAIAAPAVELPNPNGPSSKPIRSRRGARRAEVVGLEGLAGRPTDEPMAEAPRAVIPARKVASVLVAEAPARPEMPRPELIRPAVARITVPRVDDMLPPPRPAMDDSGFALTDAEVVEVVESEDAWTWRAMFSVRRSMALTALTAAIYVGATAWIPATPAITDQGSPSSSTLHIASTKHNQP
jgi:hypothetical protein